MNKIDFIFDDCYLFIMAIFKIEDLNLNLMILRSKFKAVLIDLHIDYSPIY